MNAATADQIAAVVVAARGALDQIATMMGDREQAFRITPTSTFLAFAAVSQMAQQSPSEQLIRLNAGLSAVGEVLAARGIRPIVSGKPCAEIDMEMARKACELAKKDFDKTNLEIDRRGAREQLVLKALLEFCACAKLLAPINLGAMMSSANEYVATVLRSGYLTRNEIKLGG